MSVCAEGSFLVLFVCIQLFVAKTLLASASFEQLLCRSELKANLVSFLLFECTFVDYLVQL